MHFVAVDRRTPVLRQEVEPALLQALCREALGQPVELSCAALMGSGHFNTSYRLDLTGRPPVVLRLGPPEGARLWRHERALLQRECSVLPLLRTLGEVIPALLHLDTGRRQVPRDWAVFECRPGEVWESVLPRIPATDQQRLWRQYGELVARLHALRGDRCGFPAPASAHGSVSSWFIALVDGLATDLAEQGVAVPGLDDFQARLRRERGRLDAALRPGEAPRLVHGDLWTRNVLVRQGPDGWVISALLDAERAFFGDPSAEWIFGFLDLPTAFWAGYGRCLADAALPADALWRRRAYQARGALQMMLEGCRFGFDAGFAHQQFARFTAALPALEALATGALSDTPDLPAPKVPA